MLKCPKCAENIPEETLQCPWCGSSLEQCNAVPTSLAFTPQQKKMIIIGIIGGIVLLLLIVAVINRNNSYDESDSVGSTQTTDSTYKYFYDLGRSRAKFYNVGDDRNKAANFQRTLQELPIDETIDPYADKKKDAFIKGWTDYMY